MFVPEINKVNASFFGPFLIQHILVKGVLTNFQTHFERFTSCIRHRWHIGMCHLHSGMVPTMHTRTECMEQSQFMYGLKTLLHPG